MLRDHQNTGRSVWHCVLLCLASMALLPGSAPASSGVVSRPFVLTDFNNSRDAANTVSIDADGSILAAGYTSCLALVTCKADFALARYTADGVLDPAFSGDGLQTADMGSDDRDLAATTLTNGKIATAGSIPGPCTPSFCTEDLAIARFNADGSPDTTYSATGHRVVTFGGLELNAVTIMPDGSILAVGSTPGDMLVTRYTATGAVDSTFGAGGRRSVDFGQSEEAIGATVTADGHILLVGDTGTCTDPACNFDMAVARLDHDGNPDPSFSDDGKETVDFGGLDRARAAAVSADGSVLLAGDAQCLGCDSSMAVARLSATGAQDYAFGSAGRAVLSFAGGAGAHAIAVQGDGKIALAGSAGPVGAQDFVVARLSSDGRPDPSFGTGGSTQTDLGGDDTLATMALDGAGRILTVGDSSPDCEDQSCPDDFALARYGPDGQIDRSFPPPPPLPPPLPPAAPPVVVAPVVHAPAATVSLPKGKVRLGRLLKRGLPLTVRSDQAGRVVAVASVSAKDADRAHLAAKARSHKRPVVVARGSAVLKVRHATRVLLRFSRDARRRLKTQRSVTLSLSVIVRAAAGVPSSTLTRTVTFNR